jgi:hypothetical protein
MLIALICLVFAISGLVLILLAVVVVGIRREPPTAELSSQAPSPISALVRRLLGVYVRRPDTDDVDNQPDPCLTATGHEGR